MSTSFLAIVLISIFVVLCVCIAQAIEQTGLRDQKVVLAPAIGLLCILGMMGRVPPQYRGTNRS